MKLGAALAPAPHALISLALGWQTAAASGFQGTYANAGTPSMNGVPGSLQMYNSPTTGQSYFVFIPTDPNQYNAFGINAANLNYCRPLTVDFGGIILNADISYCF